MLFHIEEATCQTVCFLPFEKLLGNNKKHEFIYHNFVTMVTHAHNQSESQMQLKTRCVGGFWVPTV